jgi:hypothetical protein
VPPGVVEVAVGGLVGAVVVGVLVAGGVALGVWVAAAGLVTVVVGAAALEPEPPASFTSAAARTPSDNTATTSATSSGARQLGEAARRVRAAAPQRRHQSCSGCSGAPQSGQASPATAGGGEGAVTAGCGGAAVLLTTRVRRGAVSPSAPLERSRSRRPGGAPVLARGCSSRAAAPAPAIQRPRAGAAAVRRTRRAPQAADRVPAAARLERATMPAMGLRRAVMRAVSSRAPERIGPGQADPRSAGRRSAPSTGRNSGRSGLRCCGLPRSEGRR